MYKSRYLLAATSTLALGLVAGSAGFAQTLVTGDIVGRVLDPSGAAVASATLTLKNEGTGATQQVKSDKNGNYRFPLLQPGKYSIHEEGNGLTADLSNVAVNVGQATPLDATPAAAHENGRFSHMQHANGHSTAGTALCTHVAETVCPAN